MNYEERVAYYYDKCEGDYKIVWSLNKTLALHYGYWDESTRNHREAVRNMNLVLARRAGVRSTDRVLDAGCGVGGSSIFLARNYGCQVVGVSLSEKQIRSAEQNAAKHNVSHLTHFVKKNYQNTGFEASSFDVVWGLESIVQSDDREGFLREAKRLLKPGGRLVIAEYMQVRSKLTSDEQSIMERWADGWACRDFTVLGSLTETMRLLGFTDIQITDETEHIRRSAEDMHRAYWFWYVPAKLAEFTGIRQCVHAGNFLTARLQYKAFRDNIVRYSIVSARLNKDVSAPGR